MWLHGIYQDSINYLIQLYKIYTTHPDNFDNVFKGIFKKNESLVVTPVENVFLLWASVANFRPL